MERENEHQGLQPIGKTLQELAALGPQSQRLNAEAEAATPVTPLRQKHPSPQIPRPDSQTSPSANSGPRCKSCFDNGALLIQHDDASDQAWMVIERYRVSERVTSLLVVCPHCASGHDRAKRWNHLPPDADGVYLDTLAEYGQQDQVTEAIQDLLLEHVWGEEYIGESHLLQVNMNRLRRKIETDPAHPRYIVTKMGVGYYLPAQPTPAT